MEQRISHRITPRNPGKEAPVAMKDEPLKQIEVELDPLLPHPPWELARVRALLASEPDPETE
jgi:hypothetical protein